jgi:hypothetical protein
MEDITVSKYHKKQLMDLGFRHSEAKCLLQCMYRVDKFKHYLYKNIDEITIFCMHDTIFAERCEIIKPKKYKFYYSETFNMVSHKTKKILKSWLINTGHKYHRSGIIHNCNLCNVFYNLKKLSEFKVDHYRYRIITLPDRFISRIMYLFFHMRKYLKYDEEYIYYLILFKIERFDKDICNIFYNDHRHQFFCNIKEFINNTKKLKVFDSLVNNNYYLPSELINNIHKLVLYHK